MGKLTNLLKWKKAISIKDEKGLTAKDENGNPIVVYMRIIGDKDLEDALLKARYASAVKRINLLNPESEDYTATISLFNEATRDQCIQIIQQGQNTNWTGEALSVVTVPELPQLDEVARDPDAPTLEELEKLDKLIEETNETYRQEINNYIETKSKALLSELENKSDEELIAQAKENIIIISAVEEYLNTLIDEKVWRSVYQDADYTLPEFQTKEEFLNLHVNLKTQLREEYQKLEAGFDDIKN